MTNHHVTCLEINVKSLLHNINYFKSKIHSHTKVLAVVKASGYGTFSDVLLASILQKEVDYLAVAYVDEGVRLRKAGVTIPILVLHPQISNISLLLAHQLEPNCYSILFLKNLLQVLKVQNKKSYPIHIKVNTGLNRLGFNKEDILQIKELIDQNTTVKVAYLFSHIAASEDLLEKTFTLEQICKFKNFYDEFIKELAPKEIPLRHMTNTSGIINYAAEAQFEMVRLGIGMYGFANDIQLTKQLQNVLCLKTLISQIHTIQKGESVGYNRGFIAQHTMKIATIPIGHADGYSRHLGQGRGYVFINNQKAFVVGNVCMDMIMIDITDISCQEGDCVMVYKDQEHIEDIAQRSETISYEILTMIGNRIRKILV